MPVAIYSARLTHRAQCAPSPSCYTPSMQVSPSNSHGCLYLVGTPIGNLEDITLRSDAGTPLVSDPGYRLVTLCARHQIPVVPIPGPSALLAALSASGIPNEEFLFVGFLPARTGERHRALERLRLEDRTLILYEAPHRVAETVSDAKAILGDRPACLAREVTKIHEEFLRGTLSELAAALEEKPARGEITLLIGAPLPGQPSINGDTSQSLADRVDELIRQAKLDRKEALKLAATACALTRR